MRIIVAMSGGVDSSVAAALLADAGHEVVGLSMRLYDQGAGETRFGSCCTVDDLRDAGRVASQLGIPHYILNLERQFEEQVISNFVREYTRGRTPIPCVHCNSDLKFSTLLERARGLGASTVATGHYARVERDPAGPYVLKRGVDPRRDQSYFLFSLNQAQLASALFPLGAMPKAEVRAYARRLDLSVSDKPESREICFVSEATPATFVERHAARPPAEGIIVDQTGRLVGRHAGVHRFTVGQRKGLGVAAPVPLYVLQIDAERATLTVGPRQALERHSFTASGVNWVAGAPPPTAIRVTAQIRYQHKEAAASVQPIDEGRRVEVRFEEPQAAIAPGQAAVFYDGDIVVGGGWID